MKSYHMKIAEIILEQLQLKVTELWAWGSKNFIAMSREVNGRVHPALMFSIRTPKVKQGGRVIISLDEREDTYIVEAIRMKKDEELLLGMVEDVYFTELHQAINSLIEDDETYTQVFF